MRSKPRRYPGNVLAVAISFVAALPGTASRAQQGPALGPYNAALGESSISGISSGAFMAVQFGFAWSSVIKGVGVVAGGPFYCAQASAADFFNGYLLPIATATGPCMTGPPPSLRPMAAKLEAKAAAGAIDSLDNVKRQKVYLFHGYNDAVVARTVSDAAAEFYRRYLGEAARGNLFYQYTRGAGHSLVVKEQGAPEINACPLNQLPFIDQCGYDQAGIILQHIYGALRPGTLGELSGRIKSFDQRRYTGSHIPDALSMGNEGYVFVPSACEQGAPCRVHIALHGCKQGVGTIGRLFIEQTGYNAWADANRIIVLYPQAKTSPYLPNNPEGCWDWWSYVDHSDDYVTKAGPQIVAIKAMLDALTSGGGPPAAPTSNQDVPAELIVTDTSDTAAALAWTPVAGASSYRIWRAGADGVFGAVAETSGPSYGDHGLAPATSYAWQVTALIGGSERPPSPSARAATRSTPGPCAAPGRCPP
jgi:poly(3-hydroxybutyrate) depolymerase